MSDHSITWSARSSSDGGIVRPKAFAVSKLMMSSNFGRSPGLAPPQAPLRGDTLISLVATTASTRRAARSATNSARSSGRPAGEPPLKGDIPSLDVAEFSQLLQELDPDGIRFDGVHSYRKKSDLWSRLRLRSERPYRGVNFCKFVVAPTGFDT